jgi:hypothetical protein
MAPSKRKTRIDASMLHGYVWHSVSVEPFMSSMIPIDSTLATELSRAGVELHLML